MTLRNVGLCAFALTSVLTFAGCQTGPKPEDKRDVAADIAAVNALRGKFSVAFNSNDAAALAALFADDAIVMPVNQPAVDGRPAIQSLYEAMFKANAVKVAITSLETQLAGDWAYDRGNATTTITPKSGNPIEESFKYLVVLKRLPGGLWKVYRDIDNSNGPPPAAPGKKASKKAVKKGGKRK
ncbi:exported hypothetical protein [Candidatus Sulfopaludibacter sp. SbA6]|nr:exported hypothetical protein [Candidatus Sulfopaludibacter sp. SbA6]